MKNLNIRKVLLPVATSLVLISSACNNEETKTIAEWCRVLDLNYHTVVTRLNRGWKIEKALSK